MVMEIRNDRHASEQEQEGFKMAEQKNPAAESEVKTQRSSEGRRLYPITGEILEEGEKVFREAFEEARARRKIEEDNKVTKELEEIAFQERLSLPGGDRDLTREEFEQLAKDGLL